MNENSMAAKTAIAAALDGLVERLQALESALRVLYLAVVEDHPLMGEALLVEDFGDTVEALLGWLANAYAAAETGREAGSAAQARQALERFQPEFERIGRCFWADLGSYERVSALMGLGRRRGREWWPWARSVRASIEECRHAIEACDRAQMYCWQTLAGEFGAALPPGSGGSDGPGPAGA